MIWVLPGVVAVLLALPVVLALRRCVAEASALRRSLSELAELAPSVRQVQLEAAAFAAAAPLVLRRRSVVDPGLEAFEPPASTPAGRRALASGPE